MLSAGKQDLDISMTSQQLDFDNINLANVHKKHQRESFQPQPDRGKFGFGFGVFWVFFGEMVRAVGITYLRS